MKSISAVEASAAPKSSKDEVPVFNEPLPRGQEARNKNASVLEAALAALRKKLDE